MANTSTNTASTAGPDQPGAGPVIGENPKPVFSGDWVAFALSDQIALAELIRRVARAGCRMAEVGSWLGNGSTQVFLRVLEPFEGAEVFCIDTWQGSSNVQRHLDFVAQYDAYGTFLHNVASAGSRTKLTPIRAASVAAADSFADGSLDFVFVDADHSYEAAKADIAAWRSKVKPGGILCGHDCELRVTAENRSVLLANVSSDGCEIPGAPFRHVHPGTVLAVDEAFGGAARLWAETTLTLADGTHGRSSIWWVVQRTGAGLFSRLFGRAS